MEKLLRSRILSSSEYVGVFGPILGVKLSLPEHMMEFDVEKRQPISGVSAIILDERLQLVEEAMLEMGVLSIGLLAESLDANKDIHKSPPVANEDMARLIKVDYSFETESVLYDVVENKPKAPTTYVAGNFSFESLHHDLEGGMLGRYRLTVCKTGNCGNVPDIYVSFVQGGNNIQEVLYDATQFPNEKPRWNFIFAIINTIYTPAENGAGDDQFVDTVYGKCQVQFGRPEDKRFRRKINNCEIKGEVNFTRIDGLQPVLYEQDVSYVQNTKVDADIVIIDAVELLRFGTPLHNKWGFTLESRTHVEITNRTMNYVPRHCNSETTTAAVCASEKFGALSDEFGDFVNLAAHFLRLLATQERFTPKVLFQLADLVSKYRSHLFEMGDSHTCEKHSTMFAEIVQEGRRASEQDWKAVLMHPENDHHRLKIAREVLLAQGPEFLDDYLLGAAHTTSNDEKWHKHLMYWMSTEGTGGWLSWKLAQHIVARFIADVSACKTEDCYVKSLEVLQNIPISASFELARGFLCTSNHSVPVQTAALQVIRAASPTLYDSKLANTLIRLFRNVCPQPTTTGESQLAIDILVRCIPEQQHVATMLLRTETLNPDDPEKWQYYFYKAVQSSGQRDELKEEVWRQMRKFKVFRPNYAQRALIADSHARWQEIADVDGYRLHSTSEVEFDYGVFKRSNFEIGLKHGKVDENLFKGTTELMAAVWNADGQTVKALEGFLLQLPIFYLLTSLTRKKLSTVLYSEDSRVTGNVMLRDTTITLPLLSGLTVEVSSSGALSFKVLTSAAVSIFNQQSLAELNTNISMGLNSRASLLHHGEAVHTLRSNVAVLTTVGAESDARIGQLPFDFCVTVQRDTTKLSFESINEIPKKPRKRTTITATRTFPGVTYRLDDNVTKQCNKLYGKNVEHSE
ncbi:hypothetical protein OSTOST_03004 [Ostertagia ostertagi]